MRPCSKEYQILYIILHLSYLSILINELKASNGSFYYCYYDDIAFYYFPYGFLQLISLDEHQILFE